MRKPPKVLDTPPDEIRRIPDRIKIMKNPTMANEFIWHFDDGRDGIHIKICGEIKNKSTYEWTKDEEWQWFVNIATSEKNLKQKEYKKSICNRNFREAIMYANEFATSITDIELKPYVTA